MHEEEHAHRRATEWDIGHLSRAAKERVSCGWQEGNEIYTLALPASVAGCSSGVSVSIVRGAPRRVSVS